MLPSESTQLLVTSQHQSIQVSNVVSCDRTLDNPKLALADTLCAILQEQQHTAHSVPSVFVVLLLAANP